MMSCRADVAPGNARYVIVVGLELEKTRMIYFGLMSVMLGVVVAVVVGAVKHDASLGATVGGAIAGFVALLHSAVVWKYS